MKTTHIFAHLLLWVLAFGANAQDKDWEFTASQIDANNYFGITSANGVIGLVSSPEPLKIQETVLNGLYDTYGRGRVSNILKGFDFANLNLWIDGEMVGANNITGFRQTLDMRQGMFISTFTTKGGAQVKHSYTALRHLPYSILVMLEVKTPKGASLELTHELTTPEHLRDVKNFYSVIDRPHVKLPLMTSVAQSPTGKHTLAAACSYLFDGVAGHDAPTLMHEDWDYNRHLVRHRQKLAANETFDMAVVVSTVGTAHYADPHNEAERLTVYAALEGKERLLARHKAAWEEIWQSDIVLDGDPASQLAIRSALYHLYAFARAGTSYSLSPMGLSGLGYNGHVFWDTEIWMYPPLLLLQPEMARSLLEYRFERLDAAKANAFAHGYRGAMYPWESDDAGQESTPVWALTGPFEHHITGCVGWAFWKYFELTGDEAWLAERGYPVLKEVADFWVSRVEVGEDGQLHINNVVGADEWAENIDDNAFTNGIAKTVLEQASLAAEALGLTADTAWRQTAERIPILKFPDGATKEHATFAGETIKQVDANLLSYPLDLVSGEEAIMKDLTYYEPRIDPNGPAMSHAVLSTLYSRLGKPQEALRLFKQSYQPNELPPFGVLAEFDGGTNPYFATGAGGMLQAVLFGFLGLDIGPEGVVQLGTSLPKGWKSLEATGVGVSKEGFKR